jgi:hypothetical protein
VRCGSSAFTSRELSMVFAKKISGVPTYAARLRPALGAAETGE